MRGLLLLVFLVLPALPVVHAADQTVRGSTLIVKDPGTDAKRKITVKAKEAASDNTLVGDPTVSGASVTITANWRDADQPDVHAAGGHERHDPEAILERRCGEGVQVQGREGRERRREDGPDQAQGRDLPDQGLHQRQGRPGGRGAAESRLGRLRVPRHRWRRHVQRPVRARSGDEQGGGSLQGREAERRGVVRADHDTTTTSTSTTTTTLGLPFIPPPGDAPLRYRDRGVRRGDHHQQHRLRQRDEHRGSDDHATVRFLRAHRRLGDTASRHHLGARRLVLLGRQDLARAGRRGEHVREGRVRERVDQLSPRARRLHRLRADRELHHRDPGGAGGCTDRGALPAHERGDLRHRPGSHRDRRLECRRDHGAPRGVQLQRGSERGGRRRGVPLGRVSARHDRCRRRAEPAVPRHGGHRRAVPVGGEHPQRARSPQASTRSSRPGPAPGTFRTCSTAPRFSIRPRTSSTGSSIWRTRRTDRDGRGAGRQAAPRP